LAILTQWRFAKWHSLVFCEVSKHYTSQQVVMNWLQS
jgi:hypothetical protein